MRGGLERWKRGANSRGVRHAIAYAMEGTCDAHLPHLYGVEALENYSDVSGATVSRFIVENGAISSDELTAGGLRVWLTGHDPITGEERGRQRLSPDADLVLDGTINHPKSYSIAALLHPGLAREFEALQDRLRDQVLLTWQRQLNARRGHNGLIREDSTRLEVVELQHRRSRALDPHIHRHLWLNVKVLGADGRWSNVDSRVAMKLHTVVNAEGELAARTDPEWIAALARHGYTIGIDGEIAELAATVRPLSRRSAQIEANRARLIAEWTSAHGGSAPSMDALTQIDRRAWAVSRPNKPQGLDEGSWEAVVRDEIAEIDQTLRQERATVELDHVDPAVLDRDLLAAMAIVDADGRSVGSSECGQLDSAQFVAAAAIAGSDGLVAVTGPAGAGKTTMLRVVFRALSAQRRRMLIVAPTRKAASVAAREVGAAATSIHALLADHGFRWGTDAAGATTWHRLSIGDVDAATGAIYDGPTSFVLRARDRIVVDEAGMVDLQVANALAELAHERGVGVAMVGDPYQALPVGHVGAMAAAVRHACAAVELDAVHRFADAEYAALTLELRHPDDAEHAARIASRLDERGHLTRVDHAEDAHRHMIDAYFAWQARGKRVALVTGANSDAGALNDEIQQRRVDRGELDPTVLAWGMGEQRILVGDTVQTRRNDRRVGVENRATWVVSKIAEDSLLLRSVNDSGDVRKVTRDYAFEHVQLAYASTVHGIQGETVDASIVGPDVDAAGLYVGLTRGREHNEVVAVAHTGRAARANVATCMLRGSTELTMQDAVRAARAEMQRAAQVRDRHDAFARGPHVAPSAGRGMSI